MRLPTRIDRPWMPGYGVSDTQDGLLPWLWAVDRLCSARRYWVASADPQATPHVSAVWGVWVEDALWFSCGPESRKARNLRANPHCAVATERADEAVTITGHANAVTAEDVLGPVGAAYVDKYGERFPDPASNPLFAVVPGVVIGIIEKESEFATRATRWTFGD